MVLLTVDSTDRRNTGIEFSIFHLLLKLKSEKHIISIFLPETRLHKVLVKI